jgi:hypothetical protein
VLLKSLSTSSLRGRAKVGPIAGMAGADLAGRSSGVDLGAAGGGFREANLGTSAGSGRKLGGGSSRAARARFLGGSEEGGSECFLERGLAVGETAASLSLSDWVFLPSASVGNTAATPKVWTRGGADIPARPRAAGEPAHSRGGTPHLSRWVWMARLTSAG